MAPQRNHFHEGDDSATGRSRHRAWDGVVGTPHAESEKKSAELLRGFIEGLYNMETAEFNLMVASLNVTGIRSQQNTGDLYHVLGAMQERINEICDASVGARCINRDIRKSLIWLRILKVSKTNPDIMEDIIRTINGVPHIELPGRMDLGDPGAPNVFPTPTVGDEDTANASVNGRGFVRAAGSMAAAVFANLQWFVGKIKE